MSGRVGLLMNKIGGLFHFEQKQSCGTGDYAGGTAGAIRYI